MFMNASISGTPLNSSTEGVRFVGDGSPHGIEMGEDAFESLITALEMRHLAYEPRTRSVRSHTVRAATLIQRLDRLRPAIDALDDAGVALAAERLRDLAEMSDQISWSRS